MNMQNEDAFEAEARDDILWVRSQEAVRASDSTKNHRANAVLKAGLEDEESPLLSTASSLLQTEGARPRSKSLSQPGNDASELPWYKTPSTFWLLPPFLPFCMAFGGIFVPKTYLILNLICQEYLSDRAAKEPSFTLLPVVFGSENPQCRDAHIQARVARFQLYQSLIPGLLAAIVSPYLGALSDRIGRKKIIAFTVMGMFFSEIITIIVGTYAGEISVYWILSGVFLDGICGSFTTSMTVAFAYAADCTAPERRNVAFGYFHGTLFTGIAIGPVLSGYLIKLTGKIMFVFYFALGCHLLFMIFVLLFVPESLSPERQRYAREKHEVKMQGLQHDTWLKKLRNYNLFEPLSILWPKGEGSSPALRTNIVLLASIDTIMFGVAMGTMQIILIYSEYMFGWTAVDSSVFISLANTCRVCVLVILLPLVTRFVRGPVGANPGDRHGADLFDINLIRAAISFDLLGYVGYALAKTGGVMILSGMIASFGGMGSPTLASALTRHIPPDRTGQVLGAQGLLHALARVVAPTTFNLIYSLTVGKFTQTVFLCLGSVFILAFILSLFLKPHVSMNDSGPANGGETQQAETTTL